MTRSPGTPSAAEPTPLQQVHVKLHQANLELDSRNFLDMGDYLQIREEELEVIRVLVQEAIKLLREDSDDFR